MKPSSTCHMPQPTPVYPKSKLGTFFATCHQNDVKKLNVLSLGYLLLFLLLLSTSLEFFLIFK